MFADGGAQPLSIAGTSSSNGAFVGCTSLSSVKLPSRLTSIGKYVFYNCSELVSVTFEEDGEGNPVSNLVTIDNYAFSGAGITEFYISNTVETIGDYAFRDATALVSLVFQPDDENAAEILKIGTSGGSVFVNTAITSLSLPARTEFVVDSKTGVHKSMFGDTANLTSIEIHSDNPKYMSLDGALYTKDGTKLVYFPAGKTSISQEQPLPDTLQYIGEYAFHYSRLTSIAVPEGVSKIGDYAFYYSSLQSVTLPASLATLGASALRECAELAVVEFAENCVLGAIGGYTFTGSAVASLDLSNTSVQTLGNTSSTADQTVFGEALTSIVLPDTLDAIGNAAFKGTSLTSISIPSSVTRIGKNAFYQVSTLTQVVFLPYEGEGIAPQLTLEDNRSSNIPTENQGVFAETGLTSVEIPARMVSVGAYAFAKIPTLVSVTFEDAQNGKLTSVKAGAFRGTGITQFVVPESVVDLGEEYVHSSNKAHTTTYVRTSRRLGVFLDCTELTSLTLSSKMTKFWWHNVVGCTSLTEILVADGSENFSSKDGVLFNSDGTRLICYPTGKTGNSYVVPDGTLNIETRAFAEAVHLRSVTVANTVAYLGYGVFQKSAVTDVVFAEGGTEDLTFDATAPAGSTSSNYNATMFGWSALESIRLPARMTTMPNFFFEGCSALTSVTFEENSRLTKMGNAVFRYCSALESFVMPDSVTTLDGTTGLFIDCTKLSKVTLSANLQKLGQNMFKNCGALETVEIPASVKTIEQYAFQNSGIKSIVIPSTLTKFGNTGLNEFLNCTRLERVEIYAPIGNNLTYLNTSYFSGCTSLKEVVLPDSIVELGNTAFKNCVSLESIDLSGIREIGNNTFEGCTSLASVDLSSVNTIGNYAFKGCTALTEVYIPDSVVDMGTSVFLDCDNLQSLTVSDGNSAYRLGSAGELLNYDGTQILYVPASATGEYVIEQGMTAGDYAFAGTGVTKVVIPNSMTVIPVGMFANCASLTEVTLHDGITEIGASAFTGSAVQSIYIGRNVTVIGNSAFKDCASLTEVTFGENGSSTLSLSASAFENCTSLASLELPRRVRAPQKTSTDRNGNVTVTTLSPAIGSYAFAGCTSLVSLTFAASGAEWMTEPLNVGAYAFNGCTSLKSVVLPDYNRSGSSATYYAIGSYAFAKIPTLVSVTFEDAQNGKLTSVKAGAFRGTGITQFVVPESVVDLGEEYVHSSNKAHTTTYVRTSRRLGVFLDCTELTSLTLSSKMTKFWWHNVVGCTSLTEILVADGSENFSSKDGVLFNSDGTRLICYPTGKTGNSYVVPDGTLNIETRAFAEAVHLRSVTVANTVAYLGYGVFQKSAVTDVVFAEGGTEDLTFDATAPAGSTSSNYNATMFGWSALESIRLPARMTTMPNFFFEGCSALTSVTFEENSRLTKMGNAVFRYCSALESFVMPDSVTTLDGTTGLFIDCTKLSKVTLSANLQKLGQNMFKNCGALETVEIPASVKTIEQYAFQNSGIKSIVIPSTLTKFGNTGLNEFLNCTRLERVEIYAPIGNNLTYLNTSYFSGCTSLKEVVLPDSIVELGNTAFKNCVSLESIDLSGIREIGNNTFEGCTSLASVDLSSVNTIGNYAFKGCTALTEVYIPDSVVDMGTSVFLDCDNLQSLTVSDGNSAYRLGSAGELLNYDGTQILYVPASATGEYVIEQGMTAGDYAFAGTGVTKVVIPNSMTVIPVGMFANCASLTEVTLHDGITEIGASAFTGSAVQSIYIGRNVTVIGNSAFKDCASLTEVTFGENGSSTLSLSASAFENCTSLASLELPRRVRAPQKTSTDRNGNVTVTTLSPAIGSYAFAGCTSLVSLTFAASGAEWMTEPLNVGAYAFNGCTSLKSVVLPDYNRSGSSATYYAIGSYAFANCTSLVSFEREGRDPTQGYRGAYYDVGGYAFFGCSALKTVKLPSNCYFDGEFIFGGTGIEEITLSLKGAYGSPYSMFEGCAQLETVAIEHDALISTVLYDRMFANCIALESVTVTNEKNGVSTIRESAFVNCASLARLNLSGGLKTIEANAFEGCTSLDFTIGASVTTIGANAFKGWTDAQTITSLIAADKIPSGWHSDWNKDCNALIVWP